MGTRSAVSGTLHEHIDWSGDEALRGLVCALPGAVVAAIWSVPFGCALALGTVIVALLGVPPRGAGRARVSVAGSVFAASYAVGTILIAWPPVAVIGLGALSYAGVLAAGRSPVGRLAGAFAPPALALGMNHPAPDGLLIAGTFAIGSAWATIVTLAWPERPATSAVRRLAAGGAIGVRMYAVSFALAGTIALVLALRLDLVHVGWAAGAALLIMRPAPGLTLGRAIERTVATFLGITVAFVIATLDPTDLAIATVAAIAIAGVVGTRTSDWYVSSAGTGLVVLLMSSLSGPEALTITYQERLIETAVGATLAIAFGVLAPALIVRSSPARR